MHKATVHNTNKLFHNNLFRYLNILLSEINRSSNKKQSETWDI